MNFPSLSLKQLLSPAAKCNRSVDFKDARQFRWLKARGKIENFNFNKDQLPETNVNTASLLSTAN